MKLLQKLASILVGLILGSLLLGLSLFITILIQNELELTFLSYAVYLINLPVLFLVYRIIYNLNKQGLVNFLTHASASPDLDFKD